MFVISHGHIAASRCPICMNSKVFSSVFPRKRDHVTFVKVAEVVYLDYLISECLFVQHFQIGLWVSRCLICMNSKVFSSVFPRKRDHVTFVKVAEVVYLDYLISECLFVQHFQIGLWVFKHNFGVHFHWCWWILKAIFYTAAINRSLLITFFHSHLKGILLIIGPVLSKIYADL